MEEYYYDIVVSFCTEHCREDCDIICGGFETEQAAMKFIEEYNVSEADYYSRCRDDETAYIEIEKRRDSDGSLVDITTVYE